MMYLSGLPYEELIRELERRAQEREKAAQIEREEKERIEAQRTSSVVSPEIQLRIDVRDTEEYLRKCGLSKEERDKLYKVCCEQDDRTYVMIGDKVRSGAIGIGQLKNSIRKGNIMDAIEIQSLQELSKKQEITLEHAKKIGKTEHTMQRGDGGRSMGMGM